ncbi:Metal-dependent hydrolases of the beta-lactamase superfamily I [hydrothermal vent metagenome]|uniref:Metal-dependent hydrolases of the beta-lactamase superfamily I n=1 Tax=hydrothermal vent metagenome TaxID=652676 RepID=A0A3B1B8L8_9ZZZZ
MRFASLGSGSKGNATLVQAGGTCVLIDCGFSLRETEARLSRYGIEAGQLDAILITHEHGDHVRGAGPLARKYDLPLWATRGTYSKAVLGVLPRPHYLDVQQSFEVQDLAIQTYPVPHDAREPCQFVFSNGQQRLGMLTDAGTITPHIETQLGGCEALLLECNHDVSMLEQGPYPYSLKQRVAGRLGHLNNKQTAALLDTLDHPRLKHLVIAHLSEQNNTPALACDALVEKTGCERDWIKVASQDNGFDWCEI